MCVLPYAVLCTQMLMWNTTACLFIGLFLLPQSLTLNKKSMAEVKSMEVISSREVWIILLMYNIIKMDLHFYLINQFHPKATIFLYPVNFNVSICFSNNTKFVIMTIFQWGLKLIHIPYVFDLIFLYLFYKYKGQRG